MVRLSPVEGEERLDVHKLLDQRFCSFTDSSLNAGFISLEIFEKIFFVGIGS